MPRKCAIVEKVLVNEKVFQEMNHKRVKEVLLPTMVKAMCLLLKHWVNVLFTEYFLIYWAKRVIAAV